MNIVGTDDPQRDATHVHTIDIWFSAPRSLWIVERLNEAGDLIGSAFASPHEADARSCLGEWLRSHPETYLAAHDESRKARKRAVPPRRRAA